MLKIEKTPNQNVWFTSDSHFGHANIVKYCSRPFKNVNNMDHCLINNWNSVVKDNDLVIHLGDFSFQSGNYLPHLKGNILLVKGNHDNKMYDPLFYNVVKQLSVEIGEYKCFLRHRPVFPDDERNLPDQANRERIKLMSHDVVICGHVHDKWKTNGKNINVGVDVWDQKLIHIDELIEFIKGL